MNIKSENRSNIVKIGDTDVEYDPRFRLYILTQIANPPLLPETCIKVCVINFTVTFEGLQDQLLSNVVHQERPDLEVQRCILLESLVNDKTKLRDIEDLTLELLSTSIGNVLDDEDLINTLDNSKNMVNVIKERLEDSQETQRNIQRSRVVYSSVADRGAVLYFVLNDLSLVDVMYQFSLNWFIAMFSNCIGTFDTSSTDQSVQYSTHRRSSTGRKVIIQSRNYSLNCISYHIISYHISYHIGSDHIISYHIISYHIISYHIISYQSYHIISYHQSYHINHINSYHISYHTISCHITSCDVLSCHVVSYVVSYHMSCHVICHVMSCHVMSCHVMSCHVMSCHVMSCHVMSCHISYI